MWTQELLDFLTREQILHLWGQPYTDKLYLVDGIHGDGQQLIWFETMNSRPFYYLIRVDSSLDVENGDDYDLLSDEDNSAYGSFTEMIMQMIEEEVGNIDNYEEQIDGLYTNEQERAEGFEPFEYKFPMFSLGAGYSWGEMDIESTIREMNRNKIPLNS